MGIFYEKGKEKCVDYFISLVLVLMIIMGEHSLILICILVAMVYFLDKIFYKINEKNN